MHRWSGAARFGNSHHIGQRRYSTSDGGRSWVEVPTRRHDLLSAAAPNGYIMMQGSEMEGGVQIVYRSGHAQTPIWSADANNRNPADCRSSGAITDFSVDDRGQLVVLLDDGTVVLQDLPDAARGQQ